MALTECRFIENHCCYEDEKHCPHVIWSSLEGRLKDALEVAKTEETLWFFGFSPQVNIDITLTLEPGIAGMRSRTSGLFQKNCDVGHVDDIQDEDGAEYSVVSDHPARKITVLNLHVEFTPHV